MRTHPGLSHALLALLALALPASAWQTSNTGPGGYSGPGDTVPNKPNGNTGGPTTPPRPNPGYNGAGDTVGPVNPTVPGSGTIPGLPNPGDPLSPQEPRTPDTPESRPIVGDPGSWQLWWHYNRWDHLEVGGIQGLLASSGYSGFFLGRGEVAQRPNPQRASAIQVEEFVLPAVIEALERGGSIELRISALHAYAKLRGLDSPEPGRDFATFARAALKSGNQDLAEKAILALGVRGDRRFVTWLLAMLDDKPLTKELIGDSTLSARGRAFALYALGLACERLKDPALGGEVYVQAARHLGAGRPEVQAAALLAIGLDPLPVEAPPGLPDRASLTRIDQILDVLAFMEDDSLSPVSRSQAPATLARLLAGAPESARTRVVHSLLVAIGAHSREPKEVQSAAVMALGAIGNSGEAPIDQEIRAQLERVAYGSSGHRVTRHLAMIALAECASRRGEGEDPYAGLVPTRRVFLRQLARTRGQTLSWTALAAGILEEDAAERGEAPSHVVADGLRHAFQKNRSTEVAGAVAIALGLLRDVEAVDLLMERLESGGEVHLRGHTALALGMIGAHRAMGPLRSVLETSLGQPFALHQAAIALALLGDGETGARLLELSEEAANPEARASIAAALGWTRDPRVLEPLSQRVRSSATTDSTRAWSLVAIGRICDEDPWPWVGRLSVGVQYDVDLPTLIEPRFQTGLLDMP